jgi:hypothetical protein
MIRRLYLVLLPCIFVSCSAYVSTNQVVGRPDRPPNGVVIVGSRTNLPVSQVNDFNEELKAAFRKCGLAAEIFAPDPLSLEPEKEHERLTAVRQKIKADIVFIYRETSSTGGVAYFDAFVLNARDALLWRGRFFVQRRLWFQPAAGLGSGSEVTGQLAHVGILQSCGPM